MSKIVIPNQIEKILQVNGLNLSVKL